jgi:hypothetical protein
MNLKAKLMLMDVVNRVEEDKKELELSNWVRVHDGVKEAELCGFEGFGVLGFVGLGGGGNVRRMYM